MFSFLDNNMLFVLKVLSLGVASVLAVLGLLYDFREKKKPHNLNIWGRINLAGLIVSLVLGVMAEKISNDREQKKNADELKDQGQLIEQNTEMLGKMETLVKSNYKLIEKTDKGLKSSDDTLKQAESTERDLIRSMDLVGDDVKADFFFRIPLGEPDYNNELETLRSELIAMATNRFSETFGPIPGIEDSDLPLPNGTSHTHITSLGHGVYKAEFGKQSPLVKDLLHPCPRQRFCRFTQLIS